MSSVSILMCSYNGDLMLSKSISAITQLQVQPFDFVEFVFVDNNSKNDLQKIVKSLWNETNTTIKLITTFEKKSGKIAAFLSGFKLCTGEYILVCDDDNELNESYLLEGVNYLKSNAKVGVLGGCGIPSSNVDLPDWLTTYLPDFACGPQATKTGNVFPGRNVVYGAGMWFRASLFQTALNNGFQFMFDYIKDDPSVKKLSNGGEDGELCWSIKYQGFEIHYLENLKFNHWIDQHKLSVQYLTQIKSRRTKLTLLSQVYRRAFTMDVHNVNNYWKKELFFIFIHFFKHFKLSKNYLIDETRRNISNLVFLLSYRNKYDKIYNDLLKYKQNFSK